MRKLITLLTATAILAACSSDAGESTTTASEDPATTVSEDTTPSPPTTSMQTTTTTVASTTTVPAEVAVPDGSGCTPGTDDLPDGEWYGLVPEASETGISFDLACWFSGEAAIAASAEDGEESPPPNDYYVRNENTQLRELDVELATPLTWYPSGDPNDEVTGTFSDWTVHIADVEPELRFGIWVTIDDGQVTEIVEKWVP